MTTTSDAFLVSLKERVTFPANQSLLDDPGLLRIADKVTKEKMVPLLLSTNQNFFVTTSLTTMVVGQDNYAINYRAIARGLRDLKIVNTNTTANTYDLSLIALEDEHLYNSQSIPTCFYFSGDQIILRPVPVSADFYLKQFFNLQPNALVSVSSAALVTSITDDVVTCSSVPTTFTANGYADFIQGTSGTATISFDAQMTNVTSTQITFGTDVVPDTLVAGDYVALKQQTPVIQLPDEAVPLLETLVGIRVLYAMGDFDGSNLLKADAQDQERDLLKVFDPRIEGAQTKIANRNGLLRGRGFSQWRARGGFYG